MKTAALALGLAALVLVGCVTPHVDQPIPVRLEGRPPELLAGYRQLSRGGVRNEVLNWLEIGTDAMQLGYYPEATEAFDEALVGIEAVWGDDEASRQARKLWYGEGRKNFKGEPYERAMAYWYRGLLYIRDDDLENARACFRSGLLQDAFAEEDQQYSDMGVFYYLEAWCNYLLDDRDAGDEVAKWLQEARPDARRPAPGENLLLAAEVNAAPRKVLLGEHGEMLGFQRGDYDYENEVDVSVDGGDWLEMLKAEDVFWQAHTRGGRPVDGIMAGKAVFKDNTAQVAETAVNTGVVGLAIAGHLRDPQQRKQAFVASAAVAAVGLVASALSSSVDARADSRHWRNLPDGLHLYSLPATPGQHQVRFRFRTANAGRPVVVERTVTVSEAGDPALAWAKKPQVLWSGRRRLTD